MDAKDDKFLREVDSNLYKLMDAYRSILRRSQIGKSVAIHEEFQIETATASLVNSSFSFFYPLNLLSLFNRLL